MLKRTLALILCFAGFGLMACDGWEENHDYTFPVFSDDGVGVAAVRHTYLGKDKFTHMAKKDFWSQVLVKENTDASVPTPLTAPRAGKTEDIFFMRTRGYVILGRRTDWLGSANGGRRAP